MLLRPSVLLRPAQGALKPAALAAAQALFLWMFLAANPLEQLATAGAFGADPRVRDRAFVFAADWRHGMSQNSRLYMPGFFAVAAAVWICPRQSARGCGGVSQRRLRRPSRLPAPRSSRHGRGPGLLPCRQRHGDIPIGAIRQRWCNVRRHLYVAELDCLRPRLPRCSRAPIVTAARSNAVPDRRADRSSPWTVGDFTSTWWTRSLGGDPVAIMSAALIPLLAAFLVGLYAPT